MGGSLGSYNIHRRGEGQLLVASLTSQADTIVGTSTVWDWPLKREDVMVQRGSEVN